MGQNGKLTEEEAREFLRLLEAVQADMQEAAYGESDEWPIQKSTAAMYESRRKYKQFIREVYLSEPGRT